MLGIICLDTDCGGDRSQWNRQLIPTTVPQWPVLLKEGPQNTLLHHTSRHFCVVVCHSDATCSDQCINKGIDAQRYACLAERWQKREQCLVAHGPKQPPRSGPSLCLATGRQSHSQSRSILLPSSHPASSLQPQKCQPSEKGMNPIHPTHMHDLARVPSRVEERVHVHQLATKRCVRVGMEADHLFETIHSDFPSGDAEVEREPAREGALLKQVGAEGRGVDDHLLPYVVGRAPRRVGDGVCDELGVVAKMVAVRPVCGRDADAGESALCSPFLIDLLISETNEHLMTETVLSTETFPLLESDGKTAERGRSGVLTESGVEMAGLVVRDVRTFHNFPHLLAGQRTGDDTTDGDRLELLVLIRVIALVFAVPERGEAVVTVDIHVGSCEWGGDSRRGTRHTRNGVLGGVGRSNGVLVRVVVVQAQVGEGDREVNKDRENDAGSITAINLMGRLGRG